MGCECSNLKEDSDQLTSFSAEMKFSVNQEIPIRVPKQTMLMSKIYSAEFAIDEEIIHPLNSQKSIQNQQITLRNILYALNGRQDSIIEEIKQKKQQKRKRSRAQRPTMDELEKLF